MLGANIRKIREVKKMKIRELADKVGVTESYMSLIETNKRKNVDNEILSKIAQALDFPLSLLYSDEKTIEMVVNELYKIAEFKGETSNYTNDKKIDAIKNILYKEPYIFYELGDTSREEILGQSIDEKANNDSKPNQSFIDEPLSKDEYVAVKAFIEIYRKITKERDDSNG